MEFIDVTADAFFDALRASPADIMPSVVHSPRWSPIRGYVSTWKNQRSGEVVGSSEGATVQTYRLTPAFLASIK